MGADGNSYQLKRLAAGLTMLALLPAIVLADTNSVTARLEALEQHLAVLEVELGSFEVGAGQVSFQRF
jgi:hypothetical protein